MHTCPELAAELKRRKAARLERASQSSINLIDNFAGDLDGESGSDDDTAHQPNLSAHFTELNITAHHGSSSNLMMDDWYVDSGAANTHMSSLPIREDKPHQDKREPLQISGQFLSSS